MGFTPEQIKGRIKSVAKQNNADARTLMRIYMMERFLERLAQSEYRDNFIIKGGILVTAMIGVAHRSTMDIDTSMKNLNLSAEDALRVVNQVKDIDLDDGVSFEVKDVSNIMDEMEYPGIRVTMNANVGRLITPLKIDISTGDVITPRAIEFNYDLLLEDRSISLWSYNLETILAEKLQTVLARGILNTRMRDFYDIRMLLDTYEDKVNKAVLKDAFAATCKKRGTDHLQEQAEEIIKIIEADKTKINLRNKSVFITGVAGFIGSNLAKRLLSTVEGVKVVGLDNMNHYYDVRLKEARLNELEQFDNFSFVKGNLADKAVIESIFEQYKPEIVVNLGAQAGVRYSITNPDAYKRKLISEN